MIFLGLGGVDALGVMYFLYNMSSPFFTVIVDIVNKRAVFNQPIKTPIKY